MDGADRACVLAMRLFHTHTHTHTHTSSDHGKEQVHIDQYA